MFNYKCKQLTSVSFPKLTNLIRSSFMKGVPNIRQVELGAVSTISPYAFTEC